MRTPYANAAPSAGGARLPATDLRSGVVDGEPHMRGARLWPVDRPLGMLPQGQFRADGRDVSPDGLAVALGVLVEGGDRVLRHGAIQRRVHGLFGDLGKRAHSAHGLNLRAAAQACNALPGPLVSGRIDVTISAAMIAPWLACYPSSGRSSRRL